MIHVPWYMSKIKHISSFRIPHICSIWTICVSTIYVINRQYMFEFCSHMFYYYRICSVYHINVSWYMSDFGHIRSLHIPHICSYLPICVRTTYVMKRQYMFYSVLTYMFNLYYICAFRTQYMYRDICPKWNIYVCLGPHKYVRFGAYVYNPYMCCIDNICCLHFHICFLFDTYMWGTKYVVNLQYMF